MLVSVCASVCEREKEKDSEKVIGRERPRLPRLLCLQCGCGATAMHQNQGERGCNSEGVGRDRMKKRRGNSESKIQRGGNGNDKKKALFEI